MLYAYCLVYPDSPHTPERLWEWEESYIHMLMQNARTFHREVGQCSFPNWSALAEMNQHIWETWYQPRPLYQPWETWQAWMAEYRELVRDMQELYDRPGKDLRTVSPTAFGLQDDLSDAAMSDEWRSLIGDQARTLAAVLHRLCTDALRNNVAHLQALVTDAEQLLTAYAEQYIDLERELTQLRAKGSDLMLAPVATQRLRTIERAIEVLHANLTAARHSLQDIRQTIKRRTIGA